MKAIIEFEDYSITKNGKVFKMYKFRTMVKNECRLQAKGKTNDEVCTKIGEIVEGDKGVKFKHKGLILADEQLDEL